MGQSVGSAGSTAADTASNTASQASSDGFDWKKLLMSGLKGGLQGYSNMQNQNAQMRQGGGAMPMYVPQGPQPPLFSAQNLPGRNPFYGQ